MQKAIIGKKIGMTQIFDEKGIMIPVTVIEAGPCVVTAKTTVENDGYASVQRSKVRPAVTTEKAPFGFFAATTNGTFPFASSMTSGSAQPLATRAGAVLLTRSPVI